MSDQISTIILRVDLDCHQCYKKIRKILCSLQDHERIRTISFDTNNNAVILDGPFDPHKLSCKIRCKGGKVIKGMQIMGDGKPEQMAGPPPSNSRKKKSKSKGKGKESPPPPAEQPPAYHPQPPTEQPQTYYQPPPPTEQPPAYHQQPPTEQPPEYHPQQPTEQQPVYHPQPPAEQPPEYHPQQPPPDREISATMQAVREEERPKERPAELETPKEMQVHFVPESGPECHKNPRERRHPMGEMASWPGPPMMEIPSLPARPVGPCRCMCCASCYQGYYASCRCSDCGRTYGYTAAAVALPPPAGCYGGARTPYCGGYSGGYRTICEEDQPAACVIM